MSAEHPAMLASRNSWRCVQAHDKQGWLDLMADDIVIEDPIGVGPTNPDGKGIRGKAQVAEFYDKNIASSEITIEAHESHVSSSPHEVAHVLTLTNVFPNGVKSSVRGIFSYRVDDAGKLVSLRGYWTLQAMSFERPA